LLIGNDLVDLRTREAVGKASDDRFIGRVFTPGEAARIKSSPDPDRTLWMLWAGKEAAFKIARKLRPVAIFAHSAYEVVPTAIERAPSAERLRGHVHVRGTPGLEELDFPLEWEVTAAFVHCVAIETDDDVRQLWTAVASHEELERGSNVYELTEREQASAHSAESLAVRRLARSLAKGAGLGDVEVVRERAGTKFGPPRLYPLGGSGPLAGWDLSLSHDGGLAAAALSGVAGSLS
jgi:phosphopantetheinyl transferase (holo-ACP synthase)